MWAMACKIDTSHRLYVQRNDIIPSPWILGYHSPDCRHRALSPEDTAPPQHFSRKGCVHCYMMQSRLPSQQIIAVQLSSVEAALKRQPATSNESLSRISFLSDRRLLLCVRCDVLLAV